MSYKDYIKWMQRKANLHNSTDERPGYKSGEIWFMSVGENIGYEEDGKGSDYARPVLIIRGFSRELFWGIPLSTTNNRGKFYHTFKAQGKSKTSVALLSQFRAFDAKRLLVRYGKASQADILAIKQKITSLLNQ